MRGFETSHIIESKDKDGEHEKRAKYLDITEEYFMATNDFTCGRSW